MKSKRNRFFLGLKGIDGVTYALQPGGKRLFKKKGGNILFS